MAWLLTDDVGRFLSAAGDFLRARPADNTVLLTTAESIQAGSGQVTGWQAPLFGWWTAADGSTGGAFLNRPPRPAVLSAMTAGAIAGLADELAGTGRFLPGVDGDAGPAQAFADAWRDRTGQLASVHRRMRLRRLWRLRPPDPVPAGAARPAGPADRGLLVDWVAAFCREVSDLGTDADAHVDDRLSHSGLMLWETGGQPVSMAGVTRQVAGHVRVGDVYTPPQFRGCGFAAGVSTAVTQAALDAGAREVVLFTDLANPTSNDLYQRLGFRPLADHLSLLFHPAGGQRR